MKNDGINWQQLYKTLTKQYMGSDAIVQWLGFGFHILLTTNYLFAIAVQNKLLNSATCFVI